MLPLARRTTQREHGDAPKETPEENDSALNELSQLIRATTPEAQSGSSLDGHVTCFGISRGISVAIAAERPFVWHQAFSALILGSALGNSRAFASICAMDQLFKTQGARGVGFRHEVDISLGESVLEQCLEEHSQTVGMQGVSDLAEVT